MDQMTASAAEDLELSFGLAFGPGVLAARMKAFTQMQARSKAAANLLTKAVRRLGEGDVPGADALIARVVAMADPDGDPPWDEAQLMLHNAVCDVLEESEEDDVAWLDRALQVLPGLDGVPKLALEKVLGVTAQDYQLRPQESARISSVVRTENPGAAADRLIEGGSIDVVEAMRQILTVVLLYQRTGSA